MRALASTIRRSASTLTIGSGAVSRTRARSSACLRAAMSADDAAEEARAALLPGGEGELDRELGPVRAQSDDLDRLADDPRALGTLADALEPGVVHRAEALGHQQRQRLAENALGA